MADTLGLQLSADGIAAARVDATTSTPPVTVPLGAAGPVAVCAVAQDDSGAVVVGEAALALSGSAVVTDPLERAAGGQIGALAAVINHVVGRAAMVTGTAPRRLAVVVPDDWPADRRDRVVQAGAAAGLAATVTVPAAAARAAAASDTPADDGGENGALALAAGAARVASLSAAPLVTREDLGEAVAPRPPVVLPPVDPPTGPVSVFDEDDHGTEPEPAPARPAAAPIPSSSAPPTAAVPVVPPTPPRPPEPEGGLRYEPPKRRIPVGVIAAAVLIGLIGAIGVAVMAFGGDDSSTTATDEPTSTTEPATTTSTVPETTTTDAATTTTDPDATTTSTTSTTTTTTTTEPPSTTTTPVPVGTPGAVTLSETGLGLDGGGLVLFDQAEDTVFAALTDVLGDPDDDSGFEENTFCVGARTRTVTWGDLEVVFTEDEFESGEARFTQWYADGHDDPEGLVTLSGVGVTATVGYLEVTLGSSLSLVPAIPDDPAGLFAATNQGSGGILNGVTSTRDPEGVVTALWAGDACTRIFT
jgi:hypothetical protein